MTTNFRLSEKTAPTSPLVEFIVDSASTVDERLSGSFEYLDGDQTAAVDNRLAAWCDASAKGDWRRFELRLSWDGLDLAAARRAVGAVRRRPDAEMPAWALFLDDFLHRADRFESRHPGDDFSHLRPDEPLPFEDILSPFVIFSRERLAAIADAGEFTGTARSELERGLLKSLITAASVTLFAEFEIMKGQQQSSWGRVIALSHDPDSTTLYDRFATQMADGGLLDLFRTYPVLGRHLAEICQLWIDATAELFDRLDADRSDLDDVFGPLGPVASAEPSLSDAHNGRRRVVSLSFESGRTLVYKPKDLGTEVHYNRVLGWLNKHDAPLDFKTLRVLNRSTHGWVEFADHTPLADTASAERYYQRAGMLLCLFYALEGTDCHYENIVACGEFPVLVDAETLMHHRARERVPDDGLGAQALANEQLDYSVLRTGMLPRWQLGPDGRTAYDVSGLGDTTGQELPFRAPSWIRVNTDRMSLETIRITIPPQTNVPVLAGQQLSLREYGKQVVSGFEQMYDFLVTHRDELLRSPAMLALAGQRVRFVYRPTKVYSLILNDLHDRRRLRDGADQSIHIEQLGRAQIPAYGPMPDEPPLLWPVFAAERRAMERGDIPFFTASADHDALTVAPDVEIESAFVESGFDLARRMLRNLGPEDLRRQLAFTEGSIYAQLARAPQPTSPADAPHSADASADGTPNTSAFVDTAVELAQHIAQKAILASDGSATWISPQYLVQAERFQLRPMDEDLYGGSSGVALFLAAVDAFAPGSGFGELAIAALKPLRSMLRDQPDRIADDLGLGGGTGLGSLIYCLVRVSQLLDEPALLDDARRAGQLVSPERIAADTNLDVLGGSAGAILGLLALHEAGTGDEAALDRAVACAEHLLTHRTASAAGPRSWASFDVRLTTGFSHGAAGIANALSRLHRHRPDPRLLAAASEAIEYEATAYSPEQGNWADYWRRDEPLYVCSWCHGAPGIGLARLGGLTTLDTPRVREDIDLAISSTLSFGLQLIDHLCCGNLGRADMMLEAGISLDRPDLVEAARRHAWQAMRRARSSGGFILNSLLPTGVDSPGFFQGTAGIGYELLRMSAPEKLPSVLSWA